MEIDFDSENNVDEVWPQSFPLLVKEWHPSKNGFLRPTHVTHGSTRKVWWMCQKGHEWEAKIYSRTLGGSGCPYCFGRKPIIGITDLATKAPHLAKEWHPNKNGCLTPSDVTSSSGKKAWWMCEKGHEWEAKISNRYAGLNCPYCSGQRLLPGFNDLATKSPEITKEWHPTKNGNLTPSDVTSASNKKVWWMCQKGHEWETTINNRTSNGSGCPYCSGRKPIMGITDLVTKVPHLAKEWHPTKNGDLTPRDVTPGSHKKVWWICDNGHEWETGIAIRARGSGCPHCYLLNVKERKNKENI